MASTNYINECKNDAYKNRLGKIEIAEKKVTAGTSIKIEKGADSAIDLTLYGKSTQATRSGYNLVKNGNKFKGACSCATGITGSLTNEGYQQFDVETGNGNYTTNWFYSINQEIEENLSEGDTFTIMFTMRRTEGMSIPPKIYIKNGMGYYSMIGTLSTEFSVVYYTGTWKDTNGIAPHLGFGGLTGTFIIKNWMIKKGGLEEWEDYGVSPSPDFPSPIESVGRKNLFDVDSITENTYLISGSGETGSSSVSNVSDYIFVKANQSYYLSYSYTSLVNTSYRSLCYYDTNKNFINGITIDPASFHTFTPAQDGYIRFSYDKNYTNIQLEKGVATDYVPYDHTEISATVTGINQWNNSLIDANNVTKNSDGFTITDKWAKRVLDNKSVLEMFKSNTKYTIKIVTKILEKPTTLGTSGTSGYDLVLYRPDNTVWLLLNSYEKYTANVGDVFTTYKTITTPKDLTNLVVLGYAFYGNNDGSTTYAGIGSVEIQQIMVVEGEYTESNFPDYEPYQSNTSTIDLQGNELCSLPNGTKDEVNITNGEALLTKRIGKVVLDGSEAWYQAGTQLPNTFTTYTFLNDMIDNYVSTDLLFMSDKFKGVSNSGNYASNDSNIITQNSSNQFKIMIIRIEKSLLSSVDVEGFKTWLSTHNVEVLYELAEPETINLGTVEMLHTYNGVSNITNSADTEMVVKAYEWTDEITNYDNLQSIQIDSGCYTDGNIIGSVYVECLNASFVAEATNLVDKIIRCQIGVKYADLSTEYICKGKYIIERPNNEITAQMSQITAYSDLYTNLEAIYICNLDYSAGNITLKDVYIDVCKQLGLTPLKTDFLNSTIPIKDNPFKNNEKNRVVLQTISKIACSFVNVYEDNNQIDLCWLSENAEPDYTFEMSDYVSVEGGQVICGPINCLIIKNSQIDDENVTIKDDESIKANGEHSITISDDYILHNAELRQQAITSIWNRVKGLKYVDCKLITYYGKPFLKLGNKIRVYTSDTDYFDTYVLKHKFEYDGAFASTIESPALTEQEIKTKQDISLGKALTNVQIDLDKQKERITSTVTTTNALQDSVSNLSETVQEQANQMQTLSTTLTQTNQSLQAEVNQINESLENGVSNLKNKLVTIDINGIAVSTNTSAIKAIMNNDRFAIKNGNTEAFYVGYDENLKKSVSRMNDLTITDYFTAGYHRQEKFEINGEQRTGWFYVGGE